MNLHLFAYLQIQMLFITLLKPATLIMLLSPQTDTQNVLEHGISVNKT
jgi:hypothetical protein